MKKNIYLSVAGTMASGKSTVAKLLAKELGFKLLLENFGENAFLPLFYREMKRWAFHSQTFFLMEKMTQLQEASVILSEAKDPRRTKEKHTGIVQDTPIQQDAFSYAKAQHVLGNLDDSEWRLYLKIYRSFEPYFPKPDLIIFLETPISLLNERIGARGRGYEQKIPLSYLELLDMLNHKWLTENKEIPVLKLDTGKLNIIKSKKARIELVNQIKKHLNNSY